MEEARTEAGRRTALTWAFNSDIRQGYHGITNLGAPPMQGPQPHNQNERCGETDRVCDQARNGHGERRNDLDPDDADHGIVDDPGTPWIGEEETQLTLVLGLSCEGLDRVALPNDRYPGLRGIPVD